MGYIKRKLLSAENRHSSQKPVIEDYLGNIIILIGTYDVRFQASCRFERFTDIEDKLCHFIDIEKSEDHQVVKSDCRLYQSLRRGAIG